MGIRIRRQWHVARIGSMKNAYRVLVGKREGTVAVVYGQD